MPSRLITFGLSLAIAALTGYLLVTGRDLLIPFAIALMIWYLINALSRLFKRHERVPGWAALTCAILTILVALALIVQIISGSFQAVQEAAPNYQANIEKLLSAAMEVVGVETMPTIGQIIEQFDMRTVIAGVVGAAANVAGSAGLIVIYVIFLLTEQRTFDAKLKALFPDSRREEEARLLLADMQRRIQTYVSVKTLLSLGTGTASYVVLVAVGVDFAGFWAFLIFLLNYVPTIGSLLGVLLPALLTIVQFGELAPFLVVAVGLGALQFVIGNILEPRMMGKSLNLSPLVVIVSLVVWGSAWGVTGMFLCVPMTVIVMIALAEFPQTRWVAILLSADGEV